MAARGKPVGVPPKVSSSAVLASLGCCQPRTGSARKRQPGECSWCVDYTTQSHDIDTDTWLCDNCMGTTVLCQKCGGFARKDGRSTKCLKCNGSWQSLSEKRRAAVEGPRSLGAMRELLKRDSPQRKQAAAEGMLRPFLLAASLTPALRNILAVQLGWCMPEESYYGDVHAEAWDLLTKSGYGLSARCQKGLAKLNPFRGNLNWHALLTFVCTTFYVPSYMNWDDEFQCEKLSSSAGTAEAMNPTSSHLDTLEIEFLEKVSKQHRSKMTRVQVCTVAQLMTTENLRSMMATMQQKGVDRQSLILFAVDGAFLREQRRVTDKRREGDGDGGESDEVEPDLLVGQVLGFLATGLEMHRDNAAVQTNVLGALADVASSLPPKEAAKVHAEPRVVIAVVTALTVHKDEGGHVLRRVACGALGRLAAISETTADLAGQAGAVATVLAVLAAKPANVGVTVNALGALADLCDQCANNANRAGAAGAVEAVVDALVMFSKHGPALKHGFRALAGLMTHNEGTAAIAWAYGGCEELAAGMKRFCDRDASIAVAACTAVATWTRVHAVGGQRLAQCGVMAVVSLAMAHHKDEESVLEAALGAAIELLQCPLTVSASHRQAKTTSMEQTIVGCMASMPTSVVVQTRGCTLLGLLASTTPIVTTSKTPCCSPTKSIASPAVTSPPLGGSLGQSRFMTTD